jgi:hypothetical protein
VRISSSPLISSLSAIGLTAAIAIILLAANFTITNAQQQQQLTSQPGEIESAIPAATIFQSTNDSFRVQVPEGWVIQDVNNTGFALLEEVRQGYGILAQLCLQEQQPTLSNVSGDTVSCQGSENDVIHIVRYPDLDTRVQAANNVTTDNNNITDDNNLLYHLQKLQEVGYRDIQIVNSTDMTVNLTNPQTNQTIITVPAKTVEMTYTTAIAPDETKSGFLISTATDMTPPNLGTTKGYTVFYEGSSVSAAEITIGFGSLRPLPSPAVQIFDSFELIAAPEVAQAIAEQAAQAAETAEGVEDGDGGDDEGDDDGDDEDGDGGEGEDT